MSITAMAQEQTQETEKPGFFKQAFRDMKESAKAALTYVRSVATTYGIPNNATVKRLVDGGWTELA